MKHPASLIPLPLAALTVAWLVGCSEADDLAAPRGAPSATTSAAAPAPGDAGVDKPQPFTLSGRVVDARGKPLEGAVVMADNTLLYNTVVQARTNADGRYRMEVPNGSWQPHAELKREYHGRTYRFKLRPDNPDPFAGSDGAVRDFEWRLTGKVPGGPEGAVFGGKVVVYAALPAEGLDDMTNVELTLTPVGSFPDDSEGAPVTGTLKKTGDGDALPDVAIGRYQITARYAPEAGGARPLAVRLRNKGEYAESVTADFEAPYGDLPIYRIDLEVKPR